LYEHDKQLGASAAGRQTKGLWRTSTLSVLKTKHDIDDPVKVDRIATERGSVICAGMTARRTALMKQKAAHCVRQRGEQYLSGLTDHLSADETLFFKRW
jgi:hypothetical protein